MDNGMTPGIWVAVIAAAALFALLVFIGAALCRLEKARREQARALDALGRELQMMEQRLNEQTARGQMYVQSVMQGIEQSAAARMEAVGGRMDLQAARQDEQMRHVSRMLDEKLSAGDMQVERMRDTLYRTLTELREDNANKLDAMQRAVDERLEKTLTGRLGESFSLVSRRLEQVYIGLGEMKSLAGGVGDLKRVLTNVKTRGVWGEMQLGALMAEALPRECYLENAQVKPGTQERVEYAVKLPGQGEGPVLLPVDAKFPVEAYIRLQDASEKGDKEAFDAAQAELSSVLLREAERIRSKYICPPETTDFAVMYLPLESLYAHALQMPGTAERIRKEKKVLIAGPSTFHAMLGSLQMGFRTLAIEQRSGEVWALLGTVKNDFAAFAELLDKTRQKLVQATESIDTAARRTQTIRRRLKAAERADGLSEGDGNKANTIEDV